LIALMFTGSSMLTGQCLVRAVGVSLA
jgi:hypothetical protein